MEQLNTTQENSTNNATGGIENSSTITFEVLYVMILYSIGIIANIHWLYGMYKVKKLHIRENYFHINLSVVHIIGMTKIVIASPTVGFKVTELTVLNRVLQSVPATPMSAVLLCIIGAIRLARLTHPYMHLTTKLMSFLLILPWMVGAGIIITDFAVSKSKKYRYIRWPIICFASSAMIIIYIKMFHTLYKRNIKTDVSPVTMAAESQTHNTVGRMSNFEIFIIDDVPETSAKDQGMSHIDTGEASIQEETHKNISQLRIKKSAKSLTEMTNSAAEATCSSSRSSSTAENRIAETQFMTAQPTSTTRKAREDETKTPPQNIKKQTQNTNVKRMENAHALLVKEYKMIVINSVVILLISLMHTVALSFLSWREGQIVNGVPYAKLPPWIGYMHIHIMLITYNIIPIISYIKSDELKKEVIKCYCFCHCRQ